MQMKFPKFGGISELKDRRKFTPYRYEMVMRKQVNGFG